MSIPYEILIRGHEGKIVGAHAIDNPGGPARPVAVDDLAVFGPEINSGLLARIAELEAALAVALSNPPRESSVLTDLDDAFEARVPIEMQSAFEPAWVVVRNLIQAGKVARAAAFVRSLDVPEAMQQVRAQIADMIDGGA